MSKSNIDITCIIYRYHYLRQQSLIKTNICRNLRLVNNIFCKLNDFCFVFT